jgi:cytoskeletal protein RodZ
MPLDRESVRLLKRLGMRLREIRLEKGWTLEDVEEHGWNDWRHLQKIESGKNCTVLTLAKLARIYKISLSELMKL